MNKSYSSETEQSLTKLAQLHASLAREVSSPIEWPEPAFCLDLEKRGGDDVRVFKHIHQSCLIHAHNFITANQIKLVYVAGAYLDSIKSENPIAIYGAARSALEFTAFLHYTTRRLLATKSNNSINWIVSGQEFFANIVRARFATSNPENIALLEKGGIAKEYLRPTRVSETIKSLVSEPEFESLHQEYRMLCDFVHHNLSSQTVTNAGTFTSDAARSAGGGGILMRTAGPITRYEYPSRRKFVRAVEQTASPTHRYVQTAVQWINRCPETPFTSEQVRKFTGSEFGLTAFAPGQVIQKTKTRNATVGRNELCPCGSGKKYKKCCLNSP